MRPAASGQGAGILFVENVGQFAAGARFQLLGAPTAAWVADDALWFTLLEPEQPQHDSVAGTHVRLSFVGANPHARLEPFARRSTTLSYYRGADAAGWQERVPVWGGVRWVDLYPGVDLEISAEGGHLTQRLVRHGAAPPPPLRLRVEGASVVSAEGGLLRLRRGTSEWALPLPASSVPLEVEGAPEAGSSLLYGSYLGTTLWDEAESVEADAAGNLYLGGWSYSLTFPNEVGPFREPHAVEAFMARMRRGGAELDYLVYFVGIVEEYTMDMVVDPSGYLYAVGRTDSSDFPVTPGAFDTTHSGDFDFEAFAVKVTPSGTLAYSTLMGASGSDEATTLAVDAEGRATVAGSTWAPDFPVTDDAYLSRHQGQRDAYVLRLNSAGSRVEYSSFVGGSSQEQIEQIALAADGTVYATGWTRSADFPTTPGAADTSYNENFDAFVVRLRPGSPELDYSTFLGGDDEDRGYALALNEAGRAVVGGRTSSSDFPVTPGALDRTFGGGECDFVACADGFLAEIAEDGSSVWAATFLGGNRWDEVRALELEPGGDVYLTGETQSPTFSVTSDAYDSTLGGERDAFLVRVSETLATLVYGTFWGGSDWDDANSLALTQQGWLLLAGSTLSDDLPVSPDAFAPTRRGDYDAWLSLLALESLTPTPTPTLSRTPTRTPTPAPTHTSTRTPTARLPVPLRPPPQSRPQPHRAPSFFRSWFAADPPPPNALGRQRVFIPNPSRY